MANEIQTKYISSASFTISLASLANGSARQSSMISNSNNYPAAIIYLCLKSGGSAPTAGPGYEIYLLRGDASSPNIVSDGAGASDAAITIENSKLLDVIQVTATSAKNFYVVIDTSRLGPLGPYWGIAVKNTSGQALDSTEGNHKKYFVYYVPEVQ